MTELDAPVARFASPMERLLYLRSTPFMSNMRGMALTTFAQRSRERFLRVGTSLFTPEQPATEVFFIVEGEVIVRRGEQVVQRIGPRGGVGFFPLLASGAPQNTAVVETACVALVLTAADVLEVLEEDFGFMENCIRGLAAEMADSQQHLESQGWLERSEPLLGELPTAGLNFVQRLSRLRMGPYAHCSLDALSDLARQAEEVRYAPGDVIWREGDAGKWGLHVVYGIVECTAEVVPRQFRMGAESVIGYLQVQAERPRAYTCVAETEVIALRGETEISYDIIEDNPDLGMVVIAFMIDRVLQLQAEIAQRGGGPR